ncbi:heterokaryon incompatibility protein-domain-containing protein [Paraphoma chrysanthemicola]|uniref:Heterokaryon incompatibility protein-domain-containing protein n=1 Tax=Paraphoma chrysanthemicola TaxID=798071 RepID=A0A8K0VXH9_9PLEO|nr:heterokaryon incompatibility protein-domain-containing protein [Paraphoma chrysanthemicola]
MEVYSHRRLDPELNAIRLLRIDKTHEGSPIVLSIRHANLDDNEPFNALSYAWGDESPLHDIVLHDGDKRTRFSVRQNLHDFLLTARNSEDDWSTKCIWIDQICINQKDHEERCHQVAQMAQIYSTALSTIVWPGLTSQEHDGGSDVASSTLLCDKDELEVIRNTPVALSEILHSEPALPSESAVRLLSMATGSLFRAPYWSRLWIIQEIVLASQVHVVIAGQIWDFNDFLLILAMLVARFKCPESKLERHIALDLQELQIKADLILFQQHLLSKLNIRLHSWADMFLVARRAKCTSPLDRVYGVMALVRKELQFYPDYTISPRQLLRSVLERQLSSATFRKSTWDTLFNILAYWEIFLEFEPIETMRDVPSEVLHKKFGDAKMKKSIVQRVLDDLKLPQPTIVMSLGARLNWKMASVILLDSYIHRADIDVCFSRIMKTNIDGHEPWSPEYQILEYIRLQQQLIKEAENLTYAPCVTRFRRRIVLSATHHDLKGWTRRSRSVIVQKLMAKNIRTSGNAKKNTRPLAYTPDQANERPFCAGRNASRRRR